MSKSKDDEEVTRLLQEWSRGEPGALDRLIPLVWEDLRQMARRHFQVEPPDHTLQPTALVIELYMRLYQQRKVRWEKREQFFAFAAMLMKRILIDSAKARKAGRRGGGAPRLPLDEAMQVAEAHGGSIDIEALAQALERLREIDPRQADIVDLRYFVGLSNEQIALHLGISVSTVKREWQIARIWLLRELRGEQDAPQAATG